MSTETPRAQSSRKRTMIIGAAIVVLLAVIAIIVASQAITASEDAAKDKASVEASTSAQVTDGGKTTSPTQATSPTQSALTGQEAELVDEANTVCEMRLIEKYSTATISPGTKSTKKADGTFDTAGSYTDGGNSSPLPFGCSSTRTDGSWTVVLKPAKNG